MLILGIDEAGRGPVIGPLVVCGVLIRQACLAELIKKGVRDSKSLIPHRRLELKKEIELLAQDYEFVIISPRQIDKKGMNELELESTIALIRRFHPHRVYIDAPTRNCNSYKEKIRGFLNPGTKIELIVQNFADQNYPVVGAASILAKVERDRRVFELKKKYGPLGSGYPSDSRTINFLSQYLRHHKSFPPIVRKRWKTLQRILEQEW
ncbi:MAG: ribonuclease HII [bacterium]